MCNERLKKIIKPAVCGLVISFIVNVVYILTLYFDYPSWLFYGVPILSTVLIWIMIKGKTLKSIFLAFGTMILSNILTEIVFSISGLTNYFYYKVYPDATEIAIGEGIILFIIYMLEIVGILIGIVFVVTSTLLRRKKDKGTLGT